MRLAIGNNNFIDATADCPPIGTVYDMTAGLPKQFVTPAKTLWRINWAHITLSTSATVGNRQLRIHISDEDGNEVMDFFPPVTQAASTVRHYAFHQGVYRETAFVGDAIQIPIPTDLYLSGGFSATIQDENDVDAADDVAIVSFQYKRFFGASAS